MKLIVLLVAILAKKLNLIPLWIYDNNWLEFYLGKLKGYGLFDQSNRPLQMLLICLPIVFMIGFVVWVFGGFLFGLVGFSISVLAVLFAFGSRDLEDELGEYLLFWRSNRKDEYRKKAREYFSLGARGVSDEDLHRAVFGQVAQRSCYFLFTPLFWFWVFGPMGAVVCGLISMVASQNGEEKNTEENKKIITITNNLVQFSRLLQETIAWLPARLLALSFSVSGHFATVFRPALDTFMSLDRSTYDVLNSCAVSALTLLPMAEDKDEMRDQCDRQMLGLQSLLSRTLGLWLIVIAVLTIFGITG